MNTTITNEYKLEDVNLYKILDERHSPFLHDISKVYHGVRSVLSNRIPVIFPHYTLHDTAHSCRVMQYMHEIVPNPHELNDLEITMLMLSALLHDVGMAVNDEVVAAIKSDSFEHCETKFSVMKELKGGDETLAMQEYVRRIHARLSAVYIKDDKDNKYNIPHSPVSFREELALICQSHTENYDWLNRELKEKVVKGKYTFYPKFIASVLRLADILDIDSNRTPYRLYEIIAPQGRSDEEWRQHYSIENDQKVIIDEKTQRKKIVFYGNCQDPKIHRRLLTYIGWVKNEIVSAMHLTKTLDEYRRLLFESEPEEHITPKGYTFSNDKMLIDFKAVVTLLMGEQIYGDKKMGLRELIQNSMDACKVRQEIENSKPDPLEKYTPKISVIIDKANNQVIIKDNGTGMSLDIIKNNFLNIGKSYYKSDNFNLKGYKYRPIANFGIGFLACFMLSDEVKVITRHFEDDKKYVVELENGEEYSCITESKDVGFEGTEVFLNYTNFMGVFEEKVSGIIEFMNLVFLTEGISVQLIDREKNISRSISIKLNEVKNFSSAIIRNRNPQNQILEIELGKYLNDIEGCAFIQKMSTKSFIREINGIKDLLGHLYLYDDKKGLSEIDDLTVISFDEYIINHQLKYLLINWRDRRNNELLNEIVVLLPKDLDFSFDFGMNYTFISAGQTIVGNLKYEHLLPLNISKGHWHRVEGKTINLFEGEKNKIYLHYNRLRRFQAEYDTVLLEDKLYIRNIYLPEIDYQFEYFASNIGLHSIICNIKSKEIISDVSRNTLTTEGKEKFNYIFSKAIHQGARDLLPMDNDEKETFDKFMAHFFSRKTEFEKEWHPAN